MPFRFAFLALCVFPALALARPLPVSLHTVEATRLGERLALTGTLAAERASALSPRVDGLVAAVRVDVGDRVARGQSLLDLDAGIARQALSRATAEAGEAATALAEAERLAAEGQRLAAQRFIPASQLATLEAAVTRAKAAHASALAAQREQQELVDRHRLPAPFAGTIAARNAEPGEWVQRGTPVLELVATDRVRLDLQVPQEHFAALAGDIDATVRPDALPGVTLPASVAARVPVSDPGARTFVLRLLVDDPQDRLLPGGSARVELALPASEPAVAVPRDALLPQPDGGWRVFVAESSGTRLVARQRTVRVIRESGGVALVGAGVRAGERVVVRGNEALQDGRAVVVATER
jgi:RND family efflux transporter MFP subunit